MVPLTIAAWQTTPKLSSLKHPFIMLKDTTRIWTEDGRHDLPLLHYPGLPLGRPRGRGDSPAGGWSPLEGEPHLSGG